MALPSGTRLGQYEIVSFIGAGGMGEVYRARDTRLGREAALKLLPESLVANPERRARFDREARAIAALNHPNIVTLYGVDEIGGATVLAMELVDGRPLSDSIPPGGLPIGRLLPLATQLADGISTAHARGVIHRDLKPANVMVTPEGRVKVLDFGLARLRPETESLNSVTRMTSATGEGRIVGTVAYMSPEQAEGKAVDERSDVFSLGIVLYEMATGRPPFTGDSSLAILSSILKDAPPPLSDSNPTLPSELSRIVRHCLAKDPEQRYQTAKDVRNDLEELKREVELGELPARSSGTQAPHLSAPRRPRRALMLGGSIAAAVVLVAIAAGWYVLARKSRAEQVPQTPTASRQAKFDRTRVAVARFENLTGDPSLDNLGAIAQDYLTTALSRVPGIQAAAVSIPMLSAIDSTRKTARSSVDPVRSLAEQTGAGTVVTGAYYLSGETLQVQARLVDAGAGKLVAAVEAISGSKSDPMAALDKVRQRVMGAVAATIDSNRAGLEIATADFKPPPYDAYLEYIAGSELLARNVRDAEAIRHFDAAARIDPDFLVAQFSSAIVHVNRGEREQAAAILERLYERRNEAADPLRLWIDAYRASLQGRTTDYVARLRELDVITPDDLRCKYMLALTLSRMNRPAESLQTLEALYAVAAKNPASTRLPGFTFLGPLGLELPVLHVLGRYEEELQAAGRWRKTLSQAAAGVQGEQVLRSAEARALAALGRTSELDRLVTDTVRLPGAGSAPGTVMVAAIAELRTHRHRAEAIAFAEKAVAWHRGRPMETARTPSARAALAEALYQAERWQEARQVFATLASEFPQEVGYQVALAQVAARLGDRIGATRVSHALQRVPSGHQAPGYLTYCRACIAALLGDKEEAVSLLQRAFAEGKACDLSVHHDMDLESLADYPPFQELMNPKG